MNCAEEELTQHPERRNPMCNPCETGQEKQSCFFKLFSALFSPETLMFLVVLGTGCHRKVQTRLTHPVTVWTLCPVVTFLH